MEPCPFFLALRARELAIDIDYIRDRILRQFSPGFIIDALEVITNLTIV